MSAPPPISPEQMHELARADERERSFSGARTLALWNGVSFAIGAGFTLLFAWGEPSVAVSALVLAGFAWVELQGRKGLFAFDPRAAQRLFWNELAVCAVVVIYAAVQVRAAFSDANPVLGSDVVDQLGASGDTVKDLMSSMTPMYRVAVVIFYSAVGVLAVLFQGGSALYHARCKKRMEAFVAETPAWVLEYKRLSPR